MSQYLFKIYSLFQKDRLPIAINSFILTENKFFISSIYTYIIGNQ